jgi:hypothetical protein
MIVIAAEHPTEVRVPEAIEHRRVGIAVPIGEAVVAAVAARPPERPVLHGRAAEPGEHELEYAARLEGMV